MKSQKSMLCVFTVAAVCLASSNGTVVSPKIAEADTVARIAEVVRTHAYAPVDARVDRVWHAIPGLCGWSVDVPASERATEAKHNNQVYVVWKAACPTKRLADLPAEPIYRGPSAERSMALMFNVSWGEAFVPSILQTLHRENLRATFFLDGAWVKKHPELAKQIVVAGHAIGSHGTGHPDFSKLSNNRLEHQIAGTNEVILHTLAKRPMLLAPPAGAYDQRTVNLARKHGMYTILWTIDTLDWRRPPANVIADRVLRGAAPGGLVLMHPTANTAAALPAIIQGLRGRGYHIKTVEQVVREEPVIKPPVVLE